MKNTVYIDNFTLPAEQSQRFYFERNLLILLASLPMLTALPAPASPHLPPHTPYYSPQSPVSPPT